VVGLDFSPVALAIARDVAGRSGVVAEFVEANVYDAVDALGGRTFDVVYTGVGALGWLPDLTAWARVAAALTKPGGVLYVMEVHPMWVATIEDGRTVSQDSISAPFTRTDDVQGTYADPDAVLEHTTAYERVFSLSDVLSAVLDAGLTIELFHEFDRTPAPTPWLELGPERLYGFPEGAVRFPLTFSLLARQPA
jgi:SAM-dependent methyltransferase